ncbi:MAG: carbamate kinase [Desulfobacterales bacterium]|nr:carbamate kinase [Desulfobacterales bacterium]
MARKTLLIALGGNALIRKHQRGSIREQFANLKIPMQQVARLSQRYRVIITHGNGPQVGNLLMQQECCDSVPKLPLEILVAQTQGQIGYMIESTLDTALMEMGIHFKQPFITLISYVVVDENDPALAAPTKPIGPVLNASPADYPFPTRTTAKGLRRVVASPRPLTVVEKREIKKLIEMGFIVICCGGGGIPVIREGRRFHGVDAVIDKDLVSARLAKDIGIDHFIIATDVPGLAVDYGTPGERFLETVNVEELGALAQAGHFPPGTVGPKVEAVSAFIRSGGRNAVVCALEDIEAAAAGRAGTRIVPA